MNKYLSIGGNREVHLLNARRLRAEILDNSNSPDQLLHMIANLSNESTLYIARCALLREQVDINMLSAADVTLLAADGHESVDDSDVINQLIETLGLKPNIDLKSVALMCIRGSVAESKERAREISLYYSKDLESKIIFTESVQKIALTTKARTLAFFHGLIDANIDPGVIIDYPGWCHSPDPYINKIVEKNWAFCISRSSSKSEDSFTCSNAGAFESVANISARDHSSIQAGVNTTFDSYHNPGEQDEVLVQQQVSQVLLSGVCTTRVLGSNAPYYVVSYDDTSGRTDSITSGDTNSIKTLYFGRGASLEQAELPEALKAVIKEAQAIEAIVPGTALDIEFLIDSDNQLTILQIRPLVGNYSDQDDALHFKRVERAKLFFKSYQFTHDGRNQGEGPSVFGVMPDANPAELIGIKPKPLAFSLYKYLITDSVVTDQRSEYGYRDVRPRRHMINIAGSPYVDVRSSFNSFTPASLPDDVSNLLINLYLVRLAKNKTLHDKVEFDVVATTWFPGVQEWFETHYNDDVSPSTLIQIVEGLKDVFLSAVNNTTSYIEAVEGYQHLFDSIVLSDLPPLHKGCTLIDICHRYGCKPFAHLARSAFVAVSVLKGFLQVGVLSREQYNLYLQSISSVSSQMERDAHDVKKGKSTREEFYQHYGHLRPGTYDISNAAYFENVHQYLDPIVESAEQDDEIEYTLPEDVKKAIESYFYNQHLNISFNEFDMFARNAISGREFGKFRYTKFLSHGMNFLINWGAGLELSRDDLAYLTIFDYHSIMTGDLVQDRGELSALIGMRKLEHQNNSKVLLPDLIVSESDFDYFYKSIDKPNYITGLNTESDMVVIASGSSDLGMDLTGKIVLINSADPGYDWLFGRSISGLITRYGGANSHMAIRCAELKVPAAIGIGDALYDAISRFKRVRLDCLNESITPC